MNLGNFIGKSFNKASNIKPKNYYVSKLEDGQYVYTLEEEMPREELLRFEALHSKLIGDQIHYCEQQRLFVNNEEMHIDDFYEETPTMSQQPRTPSLQGIKQKAGHMNSPKKSRPKKHQHEQQRWPTVSTYRKTDEVAQDTGSYKINQFEKCENISLKEIGQLLDWEKGSIRRNVQIFILTDNEDRYVKLQDMKHKGPNLLLDFFLQHAILVK